MCKTQTLYQSLQQTTFSTLSSKVNVLRLMQAWTNRILECFIDKCCCVVKVMCSHWSSMTVRTHYFPAIIWKYHTINILFSFYRLFCDLLNFTITPALPRYITALEPRYVEILLVNVNLLSSCLPIMFMPNVIFKTDKNVSVFLLWKKIICIIV